MMRKGIVSCAWIAMLTVGCGASPDTDDATVEGAQGVVAGVEDPNTPFDIEQWVTLQGQGDAFMNYDFNWNEKDGGKPYTNNKIDWPVNLVFVSSSGVIRNSSDKLSTSAVKRVVQNEFKGSGGPMRAALEHKSGTSEVHTEWDEDSGRKVFQETDCSVSSSDYNYHFRIYGPDGEGTLSHPEYGKFLIATSHVDFREQCGESQRWFGNSEEAEAYIAQRFYEHDLWVERDRVPLSNFIRDGRYRSNGYATVIHMDKPAPVATPTCSTPAVWPTAKHYVNIFATAPAYGGTSTSCGKVGENYTNTNPQYVYCRRWGAEVKDGPAHNHWWLWTDLDTGGRGWIPAYYIKDQISDQADDMNSGEPIPEC